MFLKELTDYAKSKYNMRELSRTTVQPGMSVLIHPGTKKWIAVLQRQWNMDTGEEDQALDLKCGTWYTHPESVKGWTTHPFYMKGNDWTGIRLNRIPDSDQLFELFDKAMDLADEPLFDLFGASLSDESDSSLNCEPVYTDTPLPIQTGQSQNTHPSNLYPYEDPDPKSRKIRQMKRLYEYGGTSLEAKSKNLVKMGGFMADFEDNLDEPCIFHHYYPTYHDPSIHQLRCYFSWRTNIRNGIYKYASISAAYLYIYEMINCIGFKTPQDALDQMIRFKENYLDTGYGDAAMKRNLENWIFDFVIIYDLEPKAEYGQRFEDCLETQNLVDIFLHPDEASDEDLFEAILTIAPSLEHSALYSKAMDRIRYWYPALYRKAAREFDQSPKQWEQRMFPPVYNSNYTSWKPMANALCLKAFQTQTLRYQKLEPVCQISCKNGRWTRSQRFCGSSHLYSFFREADRLLRKEWKIKPVLKPRDQDFWARAFIEKAIEEDKLEQIRASKPQVKISFDQLDTIRSNAQSTMDSLLVDETESEVSGLEENVLPSAASSQIQSEKRESEKAIQSQETGSDQESMRQSKAVLDQGSISQSEPDFTKNPQADSPFPSLTIPSFNQDQESDLDLDPVQKEILEMVLNGQSVTGILNKNHLMPEIAADAINEALYDQIGDSAIICTGNDIELIEDYRDDIIMLLGGGK